MTRCVRLFVVTLPFLVGCETKPIDRIPDDPDSMTLISIDGPETWKGPTSGEPLLGGRVLGQVEITDPAQRREIVAAVKQAIRNPHPNRMGCWMPRHVLRLSKAGKTIEVVICFECHGYAIHLDRNSSQSDGGLIHPDGQPTLDKYLKEASVPIAPKIGE